jgi:hypothetical protein
MRFLMKLKAFACAFAFGFDCNGTWRFALNCIIHANRPGGEQMTRKSARPALLIALILLGLLILAAIVVFLAYASNGFGTGMPFSGPNDQPPQVFILQPVDTTLITSGQGLSVAAYAISPGGLGRIDFLVDGHAEQQFAPDTAIQEGDASFHWFSSAAGEHRLSVIAYDLRDRPSAGV